MTDNMLFASSAPHGTLIEAAAVDDTLGELREEEIVWGESEMHHQYKDLSGGGGDRSNGTVGMKINRGDHRPIRHRSMLSRQMEMQANTWAAGSTMSAVLVAKQSAKGSARIKAAMTDRKDQEAEAGGCEEEGGIQQHGLIPPHELLARQYADTATSFSVLHGAGRTLKGMDLRRLRNEVWRQTGFVD